MLGNGLDDEVECRGWRSGDFVDADTCVILFNCREIERNESQPVVLDLKARFLW